MGLRAVFQQIIGQVEQIVPITDSRQTFVMHDRGEGGVPPFAEWVKKAPAQIRVCDLQMVEPPQDDGEAQPQTISKRLRARLRLQVYYHVGNGASQLDLLAMIGEDIEGIQRRLGDPSNWNRPTSGLESLSFIGEAPTVTWVAAGGYGVLNLGMGILYRE